MQAKIYRKECQNLIDSICAPSHSKSLFREKMMKIKLEQNKILEQIKHLDLLFDKQQSKVLKMERQIKQYKTPNQASSNSLSFR